MNQIMLLYAIWDTVAENYGFVFEQQNHGTAVRSIRTQMNADDNKDDYQLHCLGEFNHKTGTIKLNPDGNINIPWQEKEVRGDPL